MLGLFIKSNLEQVSRFGVAIYPCATDTLYIKGNFAKHSDKLSYYRFKDKVYERASGQLFRIEGIALKQLEVLSPTQQTYLNFLIDKGGLLASFDELSQLEGKFVNNNTVSKHIGAIKRLLDCAIENVPRKGYVMRQVPELVDIQSFEQQKAKRHFTLGLPHVAALLLVLLGLVVWFWPPSQSAILASKKVTMMPGSEYHGSLSPDGRFLAFEYSAKPGELNRLWLKDLKSGEQLQLTGFNGGSEDELGGFSSDGKRLLFHRTDSQNRCSVHEIVFEQPLKFTQQLLFSCHDGYKSINAEYGQDNNTIYFTDYSQYHSGHQVFRFNRQSAEISPVFSLASSGQGFYRVYPLAGNELVLLSSNDWTTSEIYLLTLGSNRLQHLADVGRTVKSMGVDRVKRQLYFVGAGGRLNRLDIASKTLKSWALSEGYYDSYVSYSAKANLLTVDGKTAFSRKIVKLKNPLKYAGFDELDEIASSGSDSLPQVCGQWVYFFSDRGGRYQLWRKDRQANRTILALQQPFSYLPESYALDEHCDRVAIIGHRSSIDVYELAQSTRLYHNDDKAFINVQFRDREHLVVSVQDDGYCLAQIDLAAQQLERFEQLPQSKTFHLSDNKDAMWFVRHQDNQLMRFDFATGAKSELAVELPVFDNSVWFSWQDKGIYYYLQNEINPLWHFVQLSDGAKASMALPKNFKNGHFSMDKDDDNSLWMVKIKSPQRDIYLAQITDN